jgi:hypothetical protein
MIVVPLAAALDALAHGGLALAAAQRIYFDRAFLYFAFAFAVVSLFSITLLKGALDAD